MFGFFHLTCFQDSHIWHVSVIHSLSLLNYFIMWISHFIYPFITCFQLWAIIKSAAMNICVQVFIWTLVVHFLGNKSKNEMTRSHDNSNINLSENKLFFTVVAPFYITTRKVYLPIFPHPHQHFLFSHLFFFYCSHPSWYEVVYHCGFDLHVLNEK